VAENRTLISAPCMTESIHSHHRRDVVTFYRPVFIFEQIKNVPPIHVTLILTILSSIKYPKIPMSYEDKSVN